MGSLERRLSLLDPGAIEAADARLASVLAKMDLLKVTLCTVWKQSNLACTISLSPSTLLI